jgi:hypothetical protein
LFRAYLAAGVRHYQWGIAILWGIGFGVAVQLFRFRQQQPADRGSGEELVLNLLPLASLALLFAAFPIYLLAICYFRARSVLKNNSNLQGKIHYSFAEDGISHQGLHSQGNLRWSGLYHVYESRGAFLLFHDKQTAQVIPTRFFADKSDIIRLRGLMRRNVARAILRD